MKRKITLSLLFAIALLALSLASCKDETPREDAKPHTHTFTEMYDENVHWEECECGEKNEAKKHTFPDAGAACSCGYVCEHTFEEGKYSFDDEEHWTKTACGHDIRADAEKHTFPDAKSACSCGYVCEHTFEEGKYSFDDEEHWTKTACGHDIRADAEKHTFGAGLSCTVCRYACDHQPSEGEYGFDEAGHWLMPSCGHDVKLFSGGHELDENAKCGVCGYQGVHDHPFSDEWSFDGMKHWHPTTCGHDAVADEGEHELDFLGKCTVCGYRGEVDHSHNFSEKWSGNDYMHWHEPTCGCFDRAEDYEPHTDSDLDGACDLCKRALLPDIDLEAKYAQYGWETANIVVCLNENSNYGELSSKVRRYLAGDVGNNARLLIDKSIAERNARAYATARVNVTYIYWGEGDTDNEHSAWGRTVKRFTENVSSGVEGSPDIYVNQLFDMIEIQMLGYFANARSTARGENYFSFADEDFVDAAEAAGEEYGYMLNYMRGASLSTKKQYLIASDYLIDFVRAFTVIPVNISLLESLDLENTTGDRTDEAGTGDPDGKFTVQDFYAMVGAGEWTYDTLAMYADAIWEKSSSVSADGTDPVNGFILTTTSKMVSSSVFYSSAPKLVGRVFGSDGMANIQYPDANDDLFAYCDALSSMVSSVGVCVESVSLASIRDRFVTDKVLFGGIVMLGSLEDEKYQAMREDAGFGVVPVPLFRQYDTMNRQLKYLTKVNGMGRIAAIAFNTDNFTACTAFLDYQSTHSTDILYQYYRTMLQYKTVEGGVGNLEMLELIRSSLRDSVEETYGSHMDLKYLNVTQPDRFAWGDILAADNYRVTIMRDIYRTVTMERMNYMKNILENYEKLRD